MIHNFSELNHYLEQFVPGSVRDGDFYKPERMFKILPLLDLPQEKLQVIHVAGTSGKTSTSYYVAEILKRAGAKVGLSVSPHIYEVNERVQINGQPLSEAKMCELFNRFVDKPGLLEIKPTYFELLTAFAFWVFVEMGCTHAVMEVGLGGLKDATNVVGNPEKVSVITDIGLDHTRILGETVDKIAYQKAGIIQHHNHVFCYQQGSVIDKTIDERAIQMHAAIHRLDEGELARNVEFVTDLSNFQKRNWLLAREVAEFVIMRDGLKQLNNLDWPATQKLNIPGRMQRIVIDDKTVIFDGAHNPQKLEAFITSLKAQYPNKRVALLIGFMNSKQSVLDDSLKLLTHVADNAITTQFPGMKDLPYKVIPAGKLAKVARQAGLKTQVEPDTQKALDLLLTQPADIFVITGSFYLVSTILIGLERKT